MQLAAGCMFAHPYSAAEETRKTVSVIHTTARKVEAAPYGTLLIPHKSAMQFEALHVCMEKNKAVFDELLVEMKAQEREGKEEQPQQQQEQPATAHDSSAPAPPPPAAAAATAATCSTDGGAHTKRSDDTAPLEAAAAVASMAAGTQPAAA